MNQFESFGKYILVERLASGGMAEVFLAKSVGAGNISKFVAVKRILPQYSDNPEFIDMFKEEARIAMNLNHSNIVHITDFGVQDKQFFLVMEYVEGQNLRQILNQLKKEGKNFSIEQCVYIGRQVAAGLDHAHRCLDASSGKPLNITHRDMSPQNVMISFEGEIKVVDFGIAKAESDVEHTRAGTIKGKFGYMSPEQAEGMAVDSRTDIFSLGIVLWELLAKDRLFTASNEAATLKKIRECQVPPLRRINPAIPSELERIVNKALAKDKSLRYQSCSAMHKELNKFMNLQYPDFSLQDFSVFMKSTFSQMYIENRKKLSEYAKITATPLGQQFDEKEKTGTKTDAIKNTTEPNAKASAEPGPATINLDAPSAGGQDYDELPPENQAVIDAFQKTNTRVNLKDLQTKARPIDKFGRPDFDGGFSRVTTPSYRRTNSTNSIRKSPAFENNQASALKTLLTLGAFFLGTAYLGFKFGILPVDLLPRDFALQVGLYKEPVFPIDRTSGHEELGSRGTYSVTIESTPPGAHIFIEGVDTGMVTPWAKQMDANRDIKITLKKEGFAPLEKTERVSHEGTSFKYTLAAATIITTPAPDPTPAVPTTSFSVSITNPASDTQIFIDDSKTPLSLPIRDFAAVPGKAIKIRAVSNSTKSRAETNIMLKANEKKEIQLTLKFSREAGGQ